MRTGISLYLVFLLAAAPSHANAQQNRAATSKTITILQLNDVYQTAPVDRGKRGGLARVATLQKKIRAGAPNTLFLLAGDFISPSIASRQFKGKQMIAALNAAGLDIATFGNHEFDFGPDVLRERMNESRFVYTIANVFEKKTGEPFGGASRYILREFGGVRVAIFGLLLAETANISAPGPGVSFEDPIAVARRLSRKLRREGADIIIALTHLPMRDDKRIAAEADVDLIIGGHEHDLLESSSGRTLITKMGSDARNLGRIDLNVALNSSSRGFRIGNQPGRALRAPRYRLQSMDIQAIAVTDAVSDDPEVAAVVDLYEKQLNASLGEVIGKTAVALDARSSVVRLGESNLGNFIADVYRQAVEADFALVNSGGIRSDATYAPGDLTKRDVLSILPYENTLAKVRLTGAHLKRLLENAVSAAGQEDGRFPQVSGISFTYDRRLPVGSRVIRIETDGQSVDPRKSYTIAVNAYILAGGDGYDFKGGEVLITPENGPVEPVVVMEAIKKAGTIAPQVEGRIKSAQANPKSAILPLIRFRQNASRLERETTVKNSLSPVVLFARGIEQALTSCCL